MADVLEINYDFKFNNDDMQNRAMEFINEQRNKMFSARLIDAFYNFAVDKEFWKNLKDENIYKALKEETPQYSMEISFEEIRNITDVFSKIIDSNSEFTKRHSSELSEKTAVMADYYKMNINEKMKLMIAADLHDIGKLAVPNSILDSPNKLTNEEFDVIKKHSYYTKLALQGLKGFEDITEWASNHHEKLNGKGYPLGKSAEELDFNSRLIACLDIYEVLTEERPYRKALEHRAAMDILESMKDMGFIDIGITKDIGFVFGGLYLLHRVIY